MKKIFIIVSSLIFSCQSENKSVSEVIASNNIELIKLKREEINNKQQEIYKKLNLIDLKLNELENNSKNPIVSTFRIIKQDFNHYVELQGDVKSEKIISIYPEFSGIINELFVESGESVGKGQILATIDDGGLKQQLSQLQITYNLAKTTYERQERLWGQKIGSEIQYLESKSMFEAQSKAIEQLTKQLNKTIIKAPFAGIIDNVIVKKGEVVYPGRSNLMLLVNMQEMYVESKVPENYINSITKGKDVVIEAPMLNIALKSKIRLVANYINPLNRTYRIEAEIPKNNYKINQSYSYAKNQTYGRLFIKGMGLQNINRFFRGCLCQGIYSDLDMINCHMVLLLKLCKDNDIECDNLNKYCKKRDSIILKIIDDNEELTRDDVKTRLFIK